MGLLRIYADSFKGLSKEAWMLSIVMLINRSGSMVLPFLGVYMTDQLEFSIKESGIVLSFYGVGSVIGSWLGDILPISLENIGYSLPVYSLVRRSFTDPNFYFSRRNGFNYSFAKYY